MLSPAKRKQEVTDPKLCLPPLGTWAFYKACPERSRGKPPEGRSSMGRRSPYRYVRIQTSVRAGSELGVIVTEDLLRCFTLACP